MLGECIRLCPPDLWRAGKQPRATWRIAYHALFYTHLYLMPTSNDFEPWERGCWHGPVLWEDEEEDTPPVETPYEPSDLMEYLQLIDQNLEGWIAALDLDASESGFDWYPIPKLDHVLVCLRHLGIHTGQMQELLYAQGVEPRWVGQGKTSFRG